MLTANLLGNLYFLTQNVTVVKISDFNAFRPFFLQAVVKVKSRNYFSSHNVIIIFLLWLEHYCLFTFHLFNTCTPQDQDFQRAFHPRS